MAVDEGNPFEDARVAGHYEHWYAEAGRRADRLEKALLARLLERHAGARTVLEVGCGTGHFTRWMAERGLEATGLDASPAMLAEARRLGGGPGYVRGDAHALPFPDRAFDLAAMITTLEFLPDPERALREAVRVARQGLLLGVLNRRSVLAWRYRRSADALWQAARFYTQGELAHVARRAAARRAGGLAWRTTLWPLPGLGYLPLPWGGFIGLDLRLRQDAPS